MNSTDANTSGAEPGEVVTFAQANRVQRTIRRVAASGPGSWLASRLLHHIDPPTFRLTRGKHTVSSLISGLPVVFLTTTGARSGKRRTSPVLGFPTTEGLVVIASNYGHAQHPPGITTSAHTHTDRSRSTATPAASGQPRPTGTSANGSGTKA